MRANRRTLFGLLFSSAMIYTARPRYLITSRQGLPRMNRTELVEPVVALARAAGDAIMEVYATDFDVQAKDDDSPLTQADMASHTASSMPGLRELTPDIPIISEESGPAALRGAQPVACVLADRSAGRHEGIRQPERRIHGQHCAHRRSNGRCSAWFTCRLPERPYTGCEGVGAAVRADGRRLTVDRRIARESSSADPRRRQSLASRRQPRCIPRLAWAMSRCCRWAAR